MGRPTPSFVSPLSCPPILRRVSRLLFWMLVGLGLLAGSLAAQPTETFSEAQRVTATDVLVRFERGGMGEWASGGEAPRGLGPDDFALRIGDLRLPVVAVADEQADEPWHLVVWVDGELSNPAMVRWAMSLLGDRVDELAALGTVEVILADPQPRRRLAPTNDPHELARVLAGLALDPPGADGLLELRDELMAELGVEGASTRPEERGEALSDPDAETPAALDADMLAALVAEETAIVTARHDLLLAHLTNMASPGARRALLLVSGGFDLDPSAYYTELGAPGVELPRRAAEAAGELARIHRATGEALAAYGWTPLVLLPPEPELLVRGWRVGKLLIRPVGPYLELPDPLDVSATESAGMRGLLQRFGRVFLFGLHAKVEGRRDPDRADAYLELADALRGQGKLEDAADSYSKALYHFANDPRTAEHQARAYAGLGQVLAEQGEAAGAHQAYRAALTLEPQLAPELGAAVAFDDPVGIWRPWVEDGAGRLVRDLKTLDTTLDDLGRSWRLTYQLDNVPAGSLTPIVVELPGHGATLRHSGWARAGTPEAVAEARLRGLLEGLVADPGVDAGLAVDLSHDGDMGLTLRALSSGRPDEGRPADEPRGFVRVSLAGDVGGKPILEHQTLSLAVLSADGGVELHPALITETDLRRVAVVVEDLVGGRWGAAAVDWR